MVQLSATRCSCIAILWVILVSFAAITLCVASQRAFIVVSVHEVVSKHFRTESITKYTLTAINTRWEATQRVMEAQLTRLTHKIAIQLHLVAESCTIWSSRSRRSVRKRLDTISYFVIDSVRKHSDTPSYPITSLHGVTTQKTVTWKAHL
jgi:hypothetical protein